MGKRTENVVLDSPLDYLQANAGRMVLCSAEPATFLEANATFALAAVAMSSGDFVIADNAGDGRKATVAAKSAVPVTVTGTGTHVALLDIANSRLLCVTI